MSDRILQRLYTNMQHQEETDYSKQPYKIKWYKTGIAASVTIAIIGLALYAFQYNNSERSFQKENSNAVLISKINDADTALTVTLSDHSHVTLQPKASITYPATFSTNKRLVYLKGDAFFSVSKNHKKPFYVYNHSLKVRVLGTSFFIKQATGEVAVRTGRVEVSENTARELISLPGKKHAKGVVLTPNQKTVLDDNQHQLSTTLVDEPVPLKEICRQGVQFNFSEATLKEVFNTLSKVYGINIALEDAKINTCTFTGDLDKKGLHEQLNLICQSISGTYKIIGTSILISGKNCN